MAYRQEQTNSGIDIVIDGFEKGIASSPYTGIANMRNLDISYYPSAAYVNYSRLPATLTDSGDDFWFAGANSVNVSNNSGWLFETPSTVTMANPVAKTTSPAGLIYILDSTGQVFKQSSVNSSSFSPIPPGTGRIGNGSSGLAYWNNYLVVFGDGMIEFCGNGTGDAGVTSANWNVVSNPSTVTVESTYQVSAFVFSGTVTMGSTTASLTTNWTGPSGTYSVRFTNSLPDIRNVIFTNGSQSVSWTGGLTSDATTQFYTFQFTVNGSSSFVGYTIFTTGASVTFSSSGTLPTNISANTTYYLLSTPDLTGVTPFAVSSTSGGQFIQLSSAGSGTITMSMTPMTLPIQNTTITGFTWTSPGTGSSTITLASLWLQASGFYNIVDPVGNNMLAQFTYQSATVTLVTSVNYQANPSGTFLVQILNPTATTNKTLNSKLNTGLFFANGRYLGEIIPSPFLNTLFNPGIPQTYAVSYSVTGTLQPQDSIVDMTDLNTQMVIAGNKDLYFWDYVSPSPSSFAPVGEQIIGLINLLNNVYVFAGQKGNVYLSNGFSAQVLFKMPDQITGKIDPVWSFGDRMFHRGRLFFQALVQDTSGNNLLAGTFSLNVSPTVMTDVSTSNALTMEAQNSYGLIPVSGTTSAGLLIDAEPSSSGQDSYYSAYSTGASTGGIDYNTTALWQNNEPTIETDIIPIGTILNKGTLGNIEFKLDRPMVTGDSITLYWRPSLTDSYQLIGTTTTTTLSDYKPTKISQSQWAQFMYTSSCASSGSSFIPLREIRIHTI